MAGIKNVQTDFNDSLFLCSPLVPGLYSLFFIFASQIAQFFAKNGHLYVYCFLRENGKRVHVYVD